MALPSSSKDRRVRKNDYEMKNIYRVQNPETIAKNGVTMNDIARGTATAVGRAQAGGLLRIRYIRLDLDHVIRLSTV